MAYPILKRTRITKSLAEMLVAPEDAPKGQLFVSYTAQGSITAEDAQHAICQATIATKGVHEQSDSSAPIDAFVVECSVEGVFRIPGGMPASGETLSEDEVAVLAGYLYPIAARAVESGIVMIGFGKTAISPNSFGDDDYEVNEEQLE